QLINYTAGTWEWSPPPSRNFHGAPPPTAGMGLIALGEGAAVISRAMESFKLSETHTLSDCATPALGQWQTTTLQDPASQQSIADYPNIYQLPDGRLFNAGPAPGIDLPNRKYKRFFNLGTKYWEESATGDNRDSNIFGSSVMYRPGKILRAGAVLEVGH